MLGISVFPRRCAAAHRRRRWRWRRILAAILTVALIDAPVALLSPTPARAVGSTLFDQPFQNNTANGTGPVVLPALPTGAAGTNVACLTASGNTSTGPLKSCAATNDAPGAGKLRLTDTTTTKEGGVFGLTSVPTSQGLDVTFNSYQYGGNGADGMTFVAAAVDPANPLAPAQIGQSGGSLGYSGTKTLKGLVNAYLGIGIDAFGNFTTSTYEGTGCTDPAYITQTKVPGQVTIRGPGAGTVGYCAINSTATSAASAALTLRATTRAASVIPMEVVINPTSTSIVTASGVVVPAGVYKVVFTPVGAGPRTLTGALPTVPAGLYPSSTWLTSAAIPKQLAFGWVGSTGSVTDFHELDNAKVVTFNPVPLLNVAATSFNATTLAPGDPVTYAVTAGVNAGADETQPVSVTETPPSGVVPVGAFGTGWVCGAPVGQRITCTNSNAPFANRTTLPPITVVGIVTGSAVTTAAVQTTISTASSGDANPATATTIAGTIAPEPTGLTLSTTASPIAGGNAVTISGSNLTGATAVEIGTAAEQQAGTPVVLLPCAGGVTSGCFVPHGNGTIKVSSMPSRSAAAAVTVTVVTQGVAGSAAYTYTSAPDTPAAPTATAGVTSATVAWTAPASNGSAITTYVVTPIRGGVAQTPISYDASATTQTLTGLSVGANYTFTVAAVNALGTGPTSPASNVVVPFTVPTAPAVTAVSAGTNVATLSWSAPSGNGSSPITGYVVTPFAGGVAQTARTFASTATTQTITGLTGGTTYTFKVAAINAAGTGPASAASPAVTVNVSPSLTNPAPPNGEVSLAYSDQLAVGGGTSPYLWTVTVGSLPPGVTLNATTGLLAGTPTAAGTFTYTVQVADGSGQTATQALSTTVIAAPTMNFTATRPGGEVGFAYSDTFPVNGGVGPFTWSVASGTVPPGLTLAAATGALAGTATTAGTYSFAVQVVDANGLSTTRTATVTIAARPSLSFPSPPSAQAGVAYSRALAVTGGTAPYAWAVTAGALPPGVTLDPATGTLAGTPTTAGSYSFTVSVTDARNVTATEATTLTVTTGPLVIVASTDVSSAVRGGRVGYTVTVTNTGAAAFTGVTFSAGLAGVLDDAAFDNDAAASAGAVSFAGAAVTWTGNLAAGASATAGSSVSAGAAVTWPGNHAAGASATVTFSVTVSNPDTGDGLLTSTVTSGTVGTNCTAGGVDPRCATTVTVSSLTIVASAGVATATPGTNLHFTVTATNDGQTPVTAQTITIPLGRVLDDAIYHTDAAATTGNIAYIAPTLTWTGSLAPGTAVTITFSATVTDPDVGDKVLTTTVSSAAPGNNCPTGGTDPRCTATVTALIPGLTIVKTADVTSTTPGGVVHYTIAVTNSGQTAYPAAAFTDPLTSVLTDTTYNADAGATAGTVSFAASTVSWTGPLAIGATATVTYSVTVKNPDPGDRLLANTVVSTSAGSNCAAGSADARCSAAVTVLVPALTIATTTASATTTPGATVGYTITVTNSGQTPYTGASLADALGGVLDDATYNGDAAATAGAVSVTAPTLTWTGDLAVGAVATITFSVTVAAPGTGDNVLTATVTSPTLGSNCASGSTDTRCVATVRVARLVLSQSYNVGTATPGSVVRLTATFVNAGQVAYTGVTVLSPTADTLDDAIPTGDQTASSGTLVLGSSGITWTGNIPAGATVTVTGTLTVRDPDPGNQRITGTLVSTAAGNNCPSGGTDPRCTALVTVLTPGLSMSVAGNGSSTTPGGVVVYTVTVTNSGQTPYAGAVVSDSIAGVLDDAAYNGDVAASSGSVSLAGSVFTWTGDLAVAGSASFTYSVTVANPDAGDKLLVSSVSSAAVGSGCRPASGNAACSSTVVVLTPELTIVSSVAPAAAVPGTVLAYTVTVTNSGQTPYTGASFADDVTGSLDDAAYNGDAAASSGSVSFTSPVFTWTGDLAVGAAATVTYSVTVNNPDVGDHTVASVVASPTVGSNCAANSTDTRCATAVAVSGSSSLTVSNVASAAAAPQGGTVTYTVTVANSGLSPYPGAAFSDDLAAVLDDAAYNGDASATAGAVSFTAPALTWTGTVPAAGLVTVTFSVTVNTPDTGDGVLTSTVSSASPGSNCPAGSTDSRCAATVTLRRLAITSTADVSTTAPGGLVRFMATFTNTGQTPYAAASVNLDAGGSFDDAAPTGDQAASSGVLVLGAVALTWTGDIPVGGTVTVVGTFVVNNPDGGDHVLTSVLSSAVPGSGCPTGAEAGCTATVSVLVPGLTITDSADRSAVLPGGTVAYTTTIVNSGQTSYSGGSVAITIAGALDDAVYNGDVVASAGTVTFATPIFTWVGDLAPGATVTVTWTVTVRNPDPADKTLVSTASSSEVGSSCPPASGNAGCGSTVAVLTPALTIVKTADQPVVVPGRTVTYTIVVTNSGQTPYTGATFTDSLAGVLDDAAYNANAAATAGAVSYTAPTLTWTGNLAVAAAATITYTVTVNNPDTGDQSLTNPAVSATPGSNCPTGGNDPHCVSTVAVTAVTTLTFTKTPAAPSTVDGATLGYTVTVANTGLSPYVGATFTDDLSGLLDDATYNGDASATAGGLSYTAPNLTWTGTVPATGSVTVTYSVHVGNPDPGNLILTNTLSSTSSDSNCLSGTTDPRCASTVTVSRLSIALAWDTTPPVVPGGTARLTATFTNTGQTPYFGIAVNGNGVGAADDVSGAVESVTSGTLVVGATGGYWTGDIPVGGVVTTITTVTVLNPDIGDGLITIADSSAAPGSNCVTGAEAGCTATVSVRTPGLTMTNTADQSETEPGGTVTYTTTIVNSGQTPYTAATVSEAIDGLLDDAVYNGDVTASAGSVSFADAAFTWTGDLAVDAAVTLRFSVTVRSPDPGDKSLVSSVSSAETGSGCPPASGNAGCSSRVVVLTPGLTISSTVTPAAATPGTVLSYTVTVLNSGQTAYTGVSFTDDVTGSLDDAVFDGNASANTGSVSFTSPVLTWTGDLALGASVTVRYSVTVDNPDTGDRLVTSTVTSSAAGNNCASGSTDGRCGTSVAVSGADTLTLSTSASAAAAPQGGTVTYTVTLANSGLSPYSGAAFSDDLTAVLDDAAYNGDASANAGAVSFTAPALSWTGTVPAAGSVTVTFSVTVNTPDTGNGVLTSTVSSASPGGNCPGGSTDSRCAATVTLQRLAIVSTADVTTTTPGGLVPFTATFTNTGQTAYAAASVNLDAGGSFDDAAPVGDQAASSGVLVLGDVALTWTGSIPVGGTVTVVGTFVVNNPDSGDKVLTSVLSSAVPGNSCPTGAEAGCTATVTVLVPGLTVTISADRPAVVPGGAVAYTTTIVNSGQTAYTGVSVAVTIGGVLDDATYGGNVTATAGTVTFTSPTFTWTGDLAPTASVTVTWTVTVRNPDTADKTLVATASSSATGSSCPPASGNAGCTSTVAVLTPELTIVKTAGVATTTPGSVVQYTIVVTNTGQTTYTGATFSDPLTGLLDDAVYRANAAATAGAVSYVAPTLTWTGNLAPGAAATITYSVTVANPDTGDRILSNTVTSVTPGNNCLAASTDARCSTTVLVTFLKIVNRAVSPTSVPGAVVRYTITITNGGRTNYTGITATDSLGAVFDDATYNADGIASVGNLTFDPGAAALVWTGDLAVGATATITVSVTVQDPDVGDRLLRSVEAADVTGSDCPTGSSNTNCTSFVIVQVPALSIVKTADTATTTPGGTVTYTITIANTGETPYTGAVVTDSLAGTLSNADYDGDAAASRGAVSYTAPILSWTGDLAVGDTAVVSYTATVKDPDPGGKTMINKVFSSAAGNTCPVGGTDPACTSTVIVLVPALTITAGADVSTVRAGDPVHYTITVTNTGQTDYPDATVAAALAGILDDAAYNGDATATTGSVVFASPVLTWTGTLAVGATATITYSATTIFPDLGDRTLLGPVTSTSSGSTCPTDGSGLNCSTTVTVLIPALLITKTVDATTVVEGGTVHYTIVVTNTGQTPYTGASVTDSLAGVLDDAAYGGNAAASSGVVSFASPNLTWTGDLGIGATAVITFSVVVARPDPGDQTLANVVTSPVVGSSCPTGAAAGCSTATGVAAQFIALTGVTPSFTVAGTPLSTVTARGAVTMTVTTNDPTGYLVTVLAGAPALTASAAGVNVTIPVADLGVRETGQGGVFRPLSALTALVVHSQTTPSSAGGDSITNDVRMTIPFVPSGAYSTTLSYIAIAQ